MPSLSEFEMVPPVLDFSALDAILSDELRTEARFGFVRIQGVRRLACSPVASQALLLNVLQIVADQTELARRLRLGMHRLTQTEYDGIMRRTTGEAKRQGAQKAGLLFMVYWFIWSLWLV